MAWTDAARAASAAARRAHKKFATNAKKLIAAGKLEQVYQQSGLKHNTRYQLASSFRRYRHSTTGGYSDAKTAQKYFKQSAKQLAFANAYLKHTRNRSIGRSSTTYAYGSIGRKTMISKYG